MMNSYLANMRDVNRVPVGMRNAWRDMHADMSAATREAVDAGACLDLAAALGFEPARREREGLG